MTYQTVNSNKLSSTSLKNSLPMKVSNRINLSSLIDELWELPKVYLAGKIRKDCWRNLLMHGLRNHKWENGSLKQEEFTYVGPFFVGCSHGCYHHPNKHGAINGCWPDYDQSKSEVVSLCFSAIDRADLFFCYIDKLDCFGTLVEIGYAHAKGKRVVIAFAPDITCSQENEFWFASEIAYKTHFNICECQLPKLFKKTLKEMP